jgi:hypothetical protein
MTASSDRRRAELAVISAAVEFVTARNSVDLRGIDYDDEEEGFRFHTAWDDLGAAVDDLHALPLLAVDMARSGPALTSEMAAAFMTGKRAASMNARIVRRLHGTTWSGDPFVQTVEDLCNVLGGKHQTVSARVHELWRAGWLVTSGQKETTSGCKADRYRLSDEARRMLDGRQTAS